MDAAEQMNDDGARSGVLGHLILGEHPVCQQNAEARARVGFQHVHDGLTHYLNLLCTQRGKYAVVNSVVQEQYLCRLQEYGNQRQQAVIYQEFNTCGQDCQDRCHNRANCIVAQNCHNHAQDANREVVNQHLETSRHTAFHQLVKLLNHPTCQRAHNHGTHQHWLTFGTAYTGDTTHNCDCAHNTAAIAADHLTALCCNQNRQQVGQHVRLNGCKLCIRNPAGFDEQGCDKAPCDKGTDIRHDHAG